MPGNGTTDAMFALRMLMEIVLIRNKAKKIQKLWFLK